MRTVIGRALLGAACLASLASSFAQEPLLIVPSQLKPQSPTAAVKRLQALDRASATPDALSRGGSVPVWPYTFTSPRDGNTYSGSIVGADPRTSASTTNVNVVLVPLVLSFTGPTTYTFDPTAPDVGCLGADTAMTRTQASPIFQPVSNFVINGANVGSTNFIDAFVRAEFWSDGSGAPLVSGKPGYHLGLQVSVAAKQTLSISTSNGSNAAVYSVAGNCSTNTVGQVNPPNLGIVNINYLDSKLKGFIRTLRLKPTQFPLFIIYGTTISAGAASNPNNCCILGYHNGSGNVSSPGQTYGISSYDQGYLFTGISDVEVLSHEVLEWVNDPSVGNVVPAWGGTGQVGGCQSNLETGDPLTGTEMPPITMANGVTYHLQENAFFSWFLGPVFTGAGGVFSSNGTFAGDAKPCPPGGSN